MELYLEITQWNESNKYTHISIVVSTKYDVLSFINTDNFLQFELKGNNMSTYIVKTPSFAIKVY